MTIVAYFFTWLIFCLFVLKIYMQQQPMLAQAQAQNNIQVSNMGGRGPTKPSSIGFPGKLAGSYTKCGAAGAQTSAHKGRQHCGCHLILRCHNANSVIQFLRFMLFLKFSERRKFSLLIQLEFA